MLEQGKMGKTSTKVVTNILPAFIARKWRRERTEKEERWRGERRERRKEKNRRGKRRDEGAEVERREEGEER